MDIRRAETGDLDRIMEIYAYARGFMAETGNPNQWIGGYPQRELLETDIENNWLYVMEDDNGIHGVFAFPVREDPTYGHIDGGWPNDNPYGTIHRIAGDGTVKGIFCQCLNFCADLIDEIRIDTHADNKVMQDAILKNGFIYCGIITGSDGNPRLAYQKSCC